MYTHILVPTDGSELAQNGVDHALSLAKALGSKVTIVTATEAFLPMVASEGWAPAPQEIERYDRENEQAASDLLAKVKIKAESLGLTADSVYVPESAAASAILKTAESRDCNLIVMSSHGRRGIRRMLLGSQAAEVLAHSKVPVLIVK